MHRRRLGFGRLAAVVALGLAAVATPTGGAWADAIPVDVNSGQASSSTLLTYNTVGSWVGAGVGSDGSSASPITFVPVTGTALTPSNLSLGAFQAAAVAAGQSVTFYNTPFDIKFNATAVNGATDFQPNGTPVDITGVLNGTLGPNQSSVTATFGGTTGAYSYPEFTTGLYSNLLSIPNNPLEIVPSTTNNGTTTAQAQISTVLSVNAPVPEPSTVVIFAATIAGLAFRHRIRRTRIAA
jgi:hypothetical protein